MKILVITQYFWPESFIINDYAKGLLERGHEVTVLTGMPNYPTGKYFPGYSMRSIGLDDYDGICVKRVPMILRGNNSKLRLVLNYMSFALSASLFIPIFCRQKYDVCFVYEPSPVTVMIPALFYKVMRKVPVLFWVQDLWPESLSATGSVNNSLVLKMVRKLVDLIYRNSDMILVQSRGFVDHVRQSDVSNDRIRYLPNWTESFYQPLKYQVLLDEKHKLKKSFRVMFAGNIGVAQDFNTILNAAERLSQVDIQWLIVGDGKQKAWLLDEIEKRNLQDLFFFLGSHPSEDMPAYFSIADVLIVTLRDEKIFSYTIPRKIQSYIACAKPVIAALAGSGAEVLKESGGIAVAPGDDKSLADSISSLFEMSVEERNKMGNSALDYSRKHFDRDKLIDLTISWMHELEKGH